MKYCPICNERFDEEIIKFCTKDGTPLVDEEQPSFTALPSENLEEPDDDFGEETVIRRKPIGAGSFESSEQSERIVIPTSPAEQHARPRTSTAYYPPPPPPNTGKTVVLTILGTLAVLGFGALLFWFLQKETPANVNTNINALLNQNANLNANLGFDSNFNFDTNANFNTNFNVGTNLNTNIGRPTPTPRPIVSPSPTPLRTPAPSPTVRPPANAGPSPLATPRTGPRPPLITNRPPGNGN